MFNQKTFNKYIIDFFQSKKGEEIIGTIIMKAIAQSLQRNIKVENGKENPGGPPIIKEEKVNILDFIAKYIPFIEGSIRGCQASSEQARNRSVETKQIIKKFGQVIIREIAEKKFQFLANKNSEISINDEIPMKKIFKQMEHNKNNARTT